MPSDFVGKKVYDQAGISADGEGRHIKQAYSLEIAASVSYGIL
jgi:hypothetical protein